MRGSLSGPASAVSRAASSCAGTGFDDVAVEAAPSWADLALQQLPRSDVRLPSHYFVLAAQRRDWARLVRRSRRSWDYLPGIAPIPTCPAGSSPTRRYRLRVG